MGLQFHETMAGELRDRWGRVRRVSFTVTAEADRLRAVLRTGELRLDGLLHAPPWTQGAVVTGTLWLAGPLRRTMRYELQGATDDGQLIRFAGQKTLTLARSALGFTQLDGALSVDGVEVATGALDFDLNAVARFFAGWSLRGRGRLDLVRAEVDAMPLEPPLSEAQLATLEALLPIFIEASPRVPAPDQETLRASIGFIGGLPSELRFGVRRGLELVDRLARLRTGRAFALLSEERRRALVEGWSKREALHAALLALSVTVRVPHFNRAETLALTGSPRFDASVTSELPRWRTQIIAPEELAEVEELEADVVVVGTGAGGGAMAARLAEAGLAVAVIEAGRWRTRADFVGSPLSRAQRLWRDRGLSYGVGNALSFLPLGELVGGTTAINSGTCLPTPDGVLREWLAEGFPSDFEPEAFRRWLEPVERELQVAPGDPAVLGAIYPLLQRGAATVGLRAHPLPRNAPGCDGQGTCILGCPTDAKRSSNVSWIPRALEAGASLYTGLRVRRLLQRGRQVQGVVAEGQDAHGRRLRVVVRARAVVLATGTLSTPALLQDSGVDGPAMGRNLSIHPGFGLYARVEEPTDPWRAVPQGVGVSGHGLDGVCLEGFYLPPQLASLTIPAWGGELNRWLDDPARTLQYGFLVRDRNDGRVVRRPGGGVMVLKNLDPRTVGRLRAGAALVAELLLAGGATRVHSAIRGVGELTTEAQARALATATLRAGDFSVLGAHPLGTCRMGADPRRSVVDFEHRVHGFANLYVADGSVVPSSLGVNPQLTIMAMALRAADGIVSALG